MKWYRKAFTHFQKFSSTGGEIVQLGPGDYPQMHLHCGQKKEGEDERKKERKKYRDE